MSREPCSLQARGLQKLYREGPVEVHAVRGVNLAVKAGSVVVLMGPSGSGKTTLLSMLGCLLTPSYGELRIMGRPVVWQEPMVSLVRRHQIGFVFQHYNLLSSLTAAENVIVALRFRGVRDPARQARALLDAVGLGDRWNFLPRDLSGGEKQRVAIARAVGGNPPIMLADEPTGNLDSASGRVVTGLLKRMAVRDNRAVVIVTHDTRIVDHADEVLFLEDGVLTPGPPVPGEAVARESGLLPTQERTPLH
jgi:putative ABC transport system ATP-binding protein